MPGSPETTPVLRWRRVVASGPATLVWVLALGALEQRARAAIVDVDEAVDV
jgi:hypothetical protein